MFLQVLRDLTAQDIQSSNMYGCPLSHSLLPGQRQPTRRSCRSNLRRKMLPTVPIIRPTIPQPSVSDADDHPSRAYAIRHLALSPSAESAGYRQSRHVLFYEPATERDDDPSFGVFVLLKSDRGRGDVDEADGCKDGGGAVGPNDGGDRKQYSRKAAFRLTLNDSCSTHTSSSAGRRS